ncbi:MAG: hypothetical protein K8M05_19800 [Deltaproteobacteria bacterium]|nr:hypothetical protein [Kofleriaceae bacterium]
MRAPTCVGCARVVLELEGQFEKLDSFYLEDGGPPPETAGIWHRRCLEESPHGEAWYRARLRNHVAVRRYVEVVTTSAWTVVRHPRTGETLAFARAGASLSLTFAEGRPRIVAGGAIHRVDEEYNLELDDRDAITVVQDALTSVGVFPVFALLEVLGVADRVVHPEALEGAVFRFDRSLHDEWQPGFVSARVEYGVFVPDELAPHVVRGRTRG